MRSFLSSSLALALGVLGAGGCSLVYDGSRFQGGTGSDGGGVDTGTEVDGGPGQDADVDAAATACEDDMDCPGPRYCVGGACAPCDGDGDGFAPPSVPSTSCPAMRHDDCDDTTDARYPGNAPICNNGIDDGCFDGASVGFPGEVDEVGFMVPFDVATSPPTAELDEVDIFARSSGRAVVFTHLVEARRSPLAVEVNLAARTSAEMTNLETWAGSDDFDAEPGTAVYAEFLRLGDQVRVSEIHVVGDTTMESASWNFFGEGATATAGAATYDLASMGAMGFRFVHPPLLVRSAADGDLFWAAHATVGGEAATFALGTASSHYARIDDRVLDGAARVWTSSSSRFGLFTMEDNPSYYVWSGNIDPATPPRMTLFGDGSPIGGGVIAPGAIVTVDEGGSRGGPYALVALPKAGMIQLVLLRCTGPAACEMVTSGSVMLPGARPAPIALSALSSTAVAFIAGDGLDVMGGARVGFVELFDSTVDEWIIPEGITGVRVPSDGPGALTAVSLDQSFTPDPVVAAAGSATLAYAHLREPAITALPTQLSVGALRACVGYDSF